VFDTYVIVDWSAARVPKTGRDSIWICCRSGDDERVDNPPTRAAARALLAEMLKAAMADGKRVLAGFDFPFGYPAGFAARLGLTGTPWRAVWDEIARLVDDRADNHNNRFDVAAALNHRISGAMFPFWGCPVRFAHDCLGPRHHRRHDSDGLLEKRLIDQWMVGAQPCWKLIGAGSVGGQVLTGIPIVRALRDDPRWADRARIWPFETGLRAPADDARIIFAEVWPSWWKVCPKLGPPNDRAQVRTVARLFATRDRGGELASWFAPAVAAADLQQVVTEEAWTLGVTAPRAPARTKQSSSPRKGGPRAAAPSLPLGPRVRGSDEKTDGSAR
jgi:hypothetical protein